MKTAQLIQAIYASIPHSNQIENLEIFDDYVLFDWRGNKYITRHYDSVGVTCGQYGGCVSVGTDASILMRHMIQSAFTKIELEK